MSDTTTRRMIKAYNSIASTTLFLSGMFQSPPENFYNTEEVEFDIIRDDEEVSVVVQDLSTGYRENSADIYANKSFKPPVNKEKIGINSFDLLKRTAGDNPFENVDFRQNIIARMFSGMSKIERKIRRTIELQASQIFQEGKVTLIDSAGIAIYELDFKAKTSHFPAAAIAWANPATATPIDDISLLAEEIRNDHLGDPNELIFGVDAFNDFIASDQVQKHLNGRRIDQGVVLPTSRRGDGGMLRGTIDIGNYTYQMWTYGGRYNHPQTGVKTQYIAPNKVIVRDNLARLDATFGAIPNIGKEMGANGPTLIPELPSRFSDGDTGIDLFVNLWLTDDGEQLFGGVGTRALLIPKAIDSFGCIDTSAGGA